MQLLALANLLQPPLDAARKNHAKAAVYVLTLPVCADWRCGVPHVDKPGFCLLCLQPGPVDSLPRQGTKSRV